jgi:hypothetical protein
MGARCTGAALAAVAACALAAVASGKTATPVLSSHAVAGVRFGTPKPQVVKALTRLLGSSSRQFVSSGCGPKYTLGELRDRYGTLAIVGTDRWRSRDGLVFYVSSQVTQPAPPTSRITEIKYGTCGDW